MMFGLPEIGLVKKRETVRWSTCRLMKQAADHSGGSLRPGCVKSFRHGEIFRFQGLTLEAWLLLCRRWQLQDGRRRRRGAYCVCDMCERANPRSIGSAFARCKSIFRAAAWPPKRYAGCLCLFCYFHTTFTHMTRHERQLDEQIHRVCIRRRRRRLFAPAEFRPGTRVSAAEPC